MKVRNICLNHNNIFSYVKFCGWHRIRITQILATNFLLVKWTSSMHCKIFNSVINIKTYHRTCVGVILIKFLTWEINTWKIITTTFPVCRCILRWWICTYFLHGHGRCCLIAMTTMRHQRVLYSSKIRLAIAPDLLFCALWILYLIF